MRTVRFGVIGGGLMGASSPARRRAGVTCRRWTFGPELVALCDKNPQIHSWYQRTPVDRAVHG